MTFTKRVYEFINYVNTLLPVETCNKFVKQLAGTEGRVCVSDTKYSFIPCGVGTYLGSHGDHTQNLVVTTLVPQGRTKTGVRGCLDFKNQETVILLNKPLHAKNTAMALSLPNPGINHSSLSSHSVRQYTYWRSPLACRVSKERENFLGWFPQPMFWPYPIPPHPHIHSSSNSFDSSARAYVGK